MSERSGDTGIVVGCSRHPMMARPHPGDSQRDQRERDAVPIVPRCTFTNGYIPIPESNSSVRTIECHDGWQSRNRNISDQKGT